ncbi:transcription elongation factor TFIIS [Jatropha curcas]|nr:transcription elongation factor TFIIS [Jatropha curcas]
MEASSRLNVDMLNPPMSPRPFKKILTVVDSVKRSRIRQQVSEAPCLVFNESHGDIVINDPVEIAVAVESALFAEWGSTSNNSKCGSFLFNIKDPKNPDFRRKILTGVIKPEGVAKLSVLDMASDEGNWRMRRLLKDLQGKDLSKEKKKMRKEQQRSSIVEGVENVRILTISCRQEVLMNLCYMQEL